MSALALPDKALVAAVHELPDDSLAANRKAALARFLDRGFPTTRLEDWKYTDLTAVAEISQRWLENGAPAPSAAAIDARIEEIRSAIDVDWIVVSNGTIRNLEALSRVDGISVATFSDLAHEPGFEHPLADLNAALLPDGLHIRVAADTAHERPVGVMIVDGADTQPGVAQARIRIELEAGSTAQFVEYHASIGDADHYANSVVELSLARGAAADYVRIQARDAAHVQTHRTAVRLDDASTIRYSGFDLGGRLVRNDLDVDIVGREATARIGGLYIAADGQHIDNHLRVDHRVGPATSEQEYAMQALTRAFGASIVSRAPVAVLADHLTEMVERRLSALSDGNEA